MSQRDIVKDSTNKSVVIRIIDSATGLPEEAVEHDTAGIAMWYRREGATKQTVATAALANLASDHADGGIEHIDDGYYRFDLPDAAFATAVDGVMIGGTVTGMIVIGAYIDLITAPATAAALTTHDNKLIVVDGIVDDILEDTVLVDKWLKNKLEFDGTTMTLYDDNGTDALLTWTLSSGNTTVVGPSNRAKAT